MAFPEETAAADDDFLWEVCVSLVAKTVEDTKPLSFGAHDSEAVSVGEPEAKQGGVAVSPRRRGCGWLLRHGSQASRLRELNRQPLARAGLESQPCAADSDRRRTGRRSKRRFGAKLSEQALERYEVRCNVAPTDEVIAIRQPDADREADYLRWGLVPHWAKGPKAGPPMINAKAETLAGKQAFRSLLATKRCLIPADGFYEWRTGADGKRVKNEGPALLHACSDGRRRRVSVNRPSSVTRRSSSPPTTSCSSSTSAPASPPAG